MIKSLFFCWMALGSVSALSNEYSSAGSIDRQEIEMKLAYRIEGDLSITSIVQAIIGNIKYDVSKVDNFIFPKLIGGQYSLDKEFTDFLFFDYYFDTEDGRLFNSDYAYRLRYRYKSLSDYFLFKSGFNLSYFYPNRCEIQLKGPYIHRASGVMEVTESRFEFTQGSDPFVDIVAPKAPWPEKDFLKYAQQGRFQNFLMRPFERLIDDLGDLGELKEILNVETVRYRNHLRLKNPWGTGPNPDHIFILTIDVSQSIRNNVYSGHKFLEVEVEIDRNVTRAIDLVLAVESDQLPHGGGYFSEVRSFADGSQQALLSDLNIIQNVVRKALFSTFRRLPLPVDNKFHRFASIIGNSR